MAYIVPIQKASGIRDATAVRFFSRRTEVLAIVKSQRLEFYSFPANELSLVHQYHLYGQITTIQRLVDDEDATEKLLITTERRRCLLLGWSADERRIVELGTPPSIDQSIRPMPHSERVHISPNSNYVLLEISPGILTVIPFEIPVVDKRHGIMRRTMRDATMLRIEQFSVRSAGFIGDSEPEKFVVLYEDGLERAHLISYELEMKPTSDGLAVIRKSGKTQRQNVPADAQLIIPVPETDGFLLVAETSITWIDERFEDFDYKLPSPTVWLQWSAIDERAFLLADDFNRLWILRLNKSDEDDTAIGASVIGEIPKASRLVYLKAGRVFVASHQGNSQLLQLSSDASSFEVLQELDNLAPILDFSVMDLGRGSGDEGMNDYSSGQARVVAGCGAFATGSLRTVRSGVALEEIMTIGSLPGVQEVFSLWTKTEMLVDCLVVSLIDQTRVFFSPSTGLIEELDDFAAFRLDQSTILAMSAALGKESKEIYLLQVTSQSVILTTPSKQSLLWRPDQFQGSQITAASANEEIIIVCVDGRTLVAFDWRSDLSVRSRVQLGQEVSVLNVPGDDLGIEPGVAIVGAFQDSTLHVIDKNLQPVRTLLLETVRERTDFDPAIFPQSLLSAQILDLEVPTLLIGMSDGSLLSGQIGKDGRFTGAQKEIVLGSQYPRLEAIPKNDGLNSVFVDCTHPTFIYGEQGRLIFSAITGDEEPISMSSFVSGKETEDFMAIATNQTLKIARVRPIRETQIKTLALGRTVRRIGYSAQNRAFALGTVSRELVENEERLNSSLQLVDEIAFEPLHLIDLGSNELVESVLVTKLPHLDPESSDVKNPALSAYPSGEELIMVGTSLIYPDLQPAAIKGGSDPTANYRGRLLIFRVNPQTRQLEEMCSQFLRGECRCLAMAGPYLVTGLSKTILLFSIVRLTATNELAVSKLTSCRLSTAPISLVVQNQTRIAVADLMKSAAILEIRKNETDGSVELAEVARHYQTIWTTAIQSIAPDEYLQSDSEGNLLLLKEPRNQEDLPPYERRQLQVLSELHLSEMVNRIQPLDTAESVISATSGTVMPVIPRAILATVEGSLYLFGLLSEPWTAPLLELQRVMAEDRTRFPTNGGVAFSEYRAFSSATRQQVEPFRFVDGEFLGKFLEVSREVQEELMEMVGERLMGGMLKPGRKETKVVLEALRRLQ